ncbi:hypothetical protein ACIP2X_15070 [Streptomyces sp. NPDC089424]|uniref:hypothetical protein n=1 Tax=Streptomyces sp. NPDC089424 TaxID=3365917 RepID=UPI003810AD4F
MARNDSSYRPTTRHALAVLATAGAALGASVAPAAADTESVLGMVHTRPTSLGNVDPEAGAAALTGSVRYVAGPVAGLKPNPLAGTGVDPLDNGVGTQLADFKPMTSKTVTGPLAQAESFDAVPVVGLATGLLT